MPSPSNSGFRPAPTAGRSRRLLTFASLAVVGLALMTGGTARAAWDDFEFGQKLIEKGMIAQARGKIAHALFA